MHPGIDDVIQRIRSVRDKICVVVDKWAESTKYWFQASQDLGVKLPLLFSKDNDGGMVQYQYSKSQQGLLLGVSGQNHHAVYRLITLTLSSLLHHRQQQTRQPQQKSYKQP